MLTQEKLKRLLKYNPSTGTFRWRLDVSQRVKSGMIAGWLSELGYWRVEIENVAHSQHRLAFLYMTGRFPRDGVDHINGRRADNKWANLREASKIINGQNRRKSNTNSGTGLLGAHFHKCTGKFCAAIRVDGKTKHIGVYETAIAAHAAYIKEKRRLHHGCTI